MAILLGRNIACQSALLAEKKFEFNDSLFLKPFSFFVFNIWTFSVILQREPHGETGLGSRPGYREEGAR